MKKNKKIGSAAKEDTHKQHAENRLRRREESLRREEENIKRRQNESFKQHVRAASDGKVPKTVTTKAYYRFSAEYPAKTNEDGFRENISSESRLSPRRKFVVFLCCIAAFAAAFTLSQVGVLLSERDIVQTTGEAFAQTNRDIRLLHFTNKEFNTLKAADVHTALLNSGCNTALFEFKNEQGKLLLTNNSEDPARGRKQIDTLKNRGIRLCAYISCFKDSSAPNELKVKNPTDNEKIFTDEKGSAWLNAFDEDARDYVLDTIKKANDAGFSYILIDNVCFPLGVEGMSASDNPDRDAADKNAVLTAFINKAVEIAGNRKLILLSDISAITGEAGLTDEKYGGRLLDNECINFAVDLRPNRQDTRLMQNSPLFDYMEKMPEVFILDAGKTAGSVISSRSGANVFAAVDKGFKDAAVYAGYAGIKNVILW